MDDQQLLRYSRHIMLDEIGIEGQQKLLEAHALIIGAGGLGSPVALYLASAGVGQSKAASGKQTLAGINPEVNVIALQERADEARLQSLVADASVVLDCTDNFRTRHAINRACVQARVPLVSGAAIRMDGQVAVFDTRRAENACYACLFPPDQVFEEVQCSTMGVFAPLVGIIGTVQAAEALKLLIGIGESLANRLLMLDVRSMEWTTIRTAKSHDCDVCASTTRAIG